MGPTGRVVNVLASDAGGTEFDSRETHKMFFGFNLVKTSNATYDPMVSGIKYLVLLEMDDISEIPSAHCAR